MNAFSKKHLGKSFTRPRFFKYPNRQPGNRVGKNSDFEAKEATELNLLSSGAILPRGHGDVLKIFAERRRKELERLEGFMWGKEIISACPIEPGPLFSLAHEIEKTLEQEGAAYQNWGITFGFCERNGIDFHTLENFFRKEGYWNDKQAADLILAVENAIGSFL